MKEHILIVDDDPSFRRVVDYTLKEAGYETTLAVNGREAREKFDEDDCAAVITDVLMPELGGLELLRQLGAIAPEVPVIVVTAHAAVDDAVDAMREGAFDYIAKPINREELKLVLSRALEFKELVRENHRLRQVVSDRLDFGNMIGSAPKMQSVLEVAAQAAQVDSTILLLGESGTGKELLAKAIHVNGPRKKGPFIAVNCGAIPAALLESELFGHRRGAFTGAVLEQRGKVEAASGGTLFLDEVGDLEPALQVKLLRLLQEKEIEKLGAGKPTKVDARILAATNRDLGSLVKSGGFREDLYYRLSVIPIELPPLRERRADVTASRRSFSRQVRAKIRQGAQARAVRIPDPGALSVAGEHSRARELDGTPRGVAPRGDGVSRGSARELYERRFHGRRGAAPDPGRRARSPKTRRRPHQRGSRKERLEPDTRGEVSRANPQHVDLSHAEIRVESREWIES